MRLLVTDEHDRIKYTNVALHHFVVAQYTNRYSVTAQFIMIIIHNIVKQGCIMVNQ